jgi:hypothetical protein
MVWYCLKCGRKNAKDALECSKCKLDKDSAICCPIVKRLRMCEECGHIHREGLHCHVYVGQATDQELIDDVISETEDELNEDESSGSDSAETLPPPMSTKSNSKSDGGSSTALIVKPKKIQSNFKPLTTPDFVKAIHYVRCNCKEGVPAECLRYAPVPRMVMVNSIHIQTYGEIMDTSEKTRCMDATAAHRSDKAIRKYTLEAENNFSVAMPHILSYLYFGQCSEVPKVCRGWNYGTSFYREYVDIRNFVPWQVSDVPCICDCE